MLAERSTKATTPSDGAESVVYGPASAVVMLATTRRRMKAVVRARGVRGRLPHSVRAIISTKGIEMSNATGDSKLMRHSIEFDG
jgi:hypothetical protein